MSPEWRHIRTRLYFTSASHLYTLFNVIHFGSGSKLIETENMKNNLDYITTMDYMS